MLYSVTLRVSLQGTLLIGTELYTMETRLPRTFLENKPVWFMLLTYHVQYFSLKRTSSI